MTEQAEITQRAQDLAAQVIDPEKAKAIWEENPYLILGVAAGAGYLLAGGLATPFTRRLVRIGMKALFVPIAASQLKSLATTSPEQELIK